LTIAWDNSIKETEVFHTSVSIKTSLQTLRDLKKTMIFLCSLNARISEEDNDFPMLLEFTTIGMSMRDTHHHHTHIHHPPPPTQFHPYVVFILLRMASDYDIPRMTPLKDPASIKSLGILVFTILSLLSLGSIQVLAAKTNAENCISSSTIYII